MYLPTILASFFALSAHAMPLAQHGKLADPVCAKPGFCYEIQSMNVTIDQRVQLSFSLYDDGQKTDNLTVCGTSWELNTKSWPQSYIKCDDDMFQWKFSKFDSVTAWGMEAAHDFRLGDFGARSFANGTAGDGDFDCATAASGAQSCSLKANHSINLVYYAMIA